MDAEQGRTTKLSHVSRTRHRLIKFSSAQVMARSRGFHRDDVLDDATGVFRNREHAETSARDLVDGTGLGRGSLYNAFGSKRGLLPVRVALVDVLTFQSLTGGPLGEGHVGASARSGLLRPARIGDRRPAAGSRGSNLCRPAGCDTIMA
uniref:TetR/AcrR family transcriptional regulator n=1 Tax=Streptomyces beihaiensis TaxID=2984495 RepID=UPI00389A25F3